MKKLLKSSVALLIFSFSMILFQLSCSKTAESQNQSQNCLNNQPKFQFKINGSLKVCDAIYNELVGWDRCPFVQYYGDGQTNWRMRGLYGRGSFTNQGIYIHGGISAPTIGTIQSSRVSGYIDNQEYLAGNITIIITAQNNNRISGTFSGNIRTTSNGNNVPITNGEFSNIPVGNFDWDIRN